MRYYALTLTDLDGQILTPTSSGGFSTNAGATSGAATFTSYINNRTDPGAPNIEFDIPIVGYDTPQGNPIIRVWGVGIQMLGQASNLNGFGFQLSAGMKKGLPLANPAQSGIVTRGTIYQAFGNWQDVNQTLDLICLPINTAPEGGISFDWPKGTSIAAAISTSLNQAYPGFTQNVNISEDLQPPNNQDQSGGYRTLDAFAQYIRQISIAVGTQLYGDSYLGISITASGNTISVADGQGQTAANVVSVNFQDLIGQPTWIDGTSITFKTVLRADIHVQDQVKLPSGIIAPYALTSQSAAAPGTPSRSKTAFQGKFVVLEVHHYANFRSADAESWNTTFRAVSIPATPVSATSFVDLPGFYSEFPGGAPPT